MTRWGILSTARIAEKLIGGARVSSDASIVAVGSRDLARARAFADEHGIPEAFGSYEELLASPDVDAIYIPLPNSMHVEWSIKALEAGKHVLSEKPMARSPEEVSAGVRCRRAGGPRADGGVHVALPRADRGARPRGGGRSASCG